ncbi:hypothetical protein Acsp02_95300 [Actinoplanes sp. NBRC 103695]|nr:hypothetical protein Acsp02_95300 [Actinoplanes sp. NBRC 103695]
MSVEYGVFLGLDVGKSDHHAVGLALDGKRLHDAPLPNTEVRLRALFDKLARHGRILVVVDQPASIGALAVAVARACGHQVAYLPGLAMRRLADLHPGTAKTDARDAYVIADAARTLPHTLRRVDAGDEAFAELEVLIGYDDDLAAESTRISNRIRGLLTQIHPALEDVLGPKISHPAAQELLSKCGGPTGLRKAGRRKLLALVACRAPRMGTRLVEQVLTALDEQTVTVPGTAAAETVLPRLADSLRQVLQQRDQVATEVERILVNIHRWIEAKRFWVPTPSTAPRHWQCGRPETRRIMAVAFSATIGRSSSSQSQCSHIHWPLFLHVTERPAGT